ncbi:MAG: hypothetical protein J6Q22_18080 [Prevotella sp.]|nr:hypothetical protein [Prevotella sp.]
MLTKEIMISVMLMSIFILTVYIFYNIDIDDIDQLDDFLIESALDDPLDFITDS